MWVFDGKGFTMVISLIWIEAKKGRDASGLICLAGVHRPYAAEALLLTPLRVATIFSLALAAFSSFKFEVKRRTTSS